MAYVYLCTIVTPISDECTDMNDESCILFFYRVMVLSRDYSMTFNRSYFAIGRMTGTLSSKTCIIIWMFKKSCYHVCLSPIPLCDDGSNVKRC